MKRLYRICVCLLPCLLPVSGYSSSVSWERYVEMFTDETMQTPLGQVWDIETAFGKLYFATNDGMFGYNGSFWETYHQKGNRAVRALYYDEDASRLYSSGVNEFGYWIVDDTGRLVYNLLHRNADFRSNSEEYWRIAENKATGNVFFQSREVLQVYDPASGKIESVRPRSFFQYMFCVRGEIFVQDGSTLLRVGQDGMIPVCEIDSRITNLIPVSVKGGGYDLIAVTEHKGLLKVLPDGTLEDLNRETNGILSKAKITCCERYDDELILTGTTRYGVLIIDNSGNIDTSVNCGQVLDNLTVLSIAPDESGDIWVGLDNGVAKVDNTTKDWYFFDRNLGKVHSVQTLPDGSLLAGSNKGLFLLGAGNDAGTEFVHGSAGAVWGLSNIAGSVYVLHDRGLFRLGRDMKADPVFTGTGVYSMKRCRRDTSLYIAGTYSGFMLLKLDGSTLAPVCRITGFNGFTRSFDIDPDDRIWVTVPGTGFVRLTLSADGSSFSDTEEYDLAGSGNAEENVFSFMMDGSLILVCGKKAWTPAAGTDSLAVSEEASALLAACDAGVKNIFSHGDDYWYVSDRMVGTVSLEDGVYAGHYGIFEYVAPSDISSDLFFFEDACYVGFRNGIGCSYGYCGHSHHIEIEYASAENFDSIIYYDRTEPVFEIPGNMNVVKLRLAGLPSDRLVEYRVSGLSPQWQTEAVSDYLMLPSLPFGTCTVELRVPGMSETVSLDLKRLFPWYLSLPMLFVYVMFLIASSYTIAYILTRKAKKQHARQLRHEKLKRESEIAKLEKENLIKEKRISEMEKDRLKSDLVEKNKRLANITMSNVKRNNMLSALRREIKTLESVESLPQLKSKAARIIRQIDANMNDESDWKVSEDYFNIIYDGLLDRLKEKYPALSKTDMKICVYIKLNLSTKEIADLMNISPRSVEMARYRLRKKLGLGPNGDIASVLR